MKKSFLLKYSLLSILTITLNQGLFSQQISDRNQIILNAVNSVSVNSISDNIDKLVSFKTRHNLSTRSNPDEGIGAAYKYLYNKLITIGNSGINKPFVELADFRSGSKDNRLGREITLTNVIATFKGRDTSDNRIIILLAHYDSRSYDNSDSTIFAPGANDNGSGVSALMEIARVLAANPLPVTVKLMFLSGEEHGLLGAAYMASVAKREGWNIIAVINNDMIGNSRSSGTELTNNTIVRVFSENIPYVENEAMKRERVMNSAENDSKSRQLARYIKEIGERYVDNLTIKLVYRNDRFGRGGDHTPFSREGDTAVRLCEYYENYDRTHQIVEIKDGKPTGDVKSGVDLEYVRKNSAVNLAVVMNLASAPDIPSDVVMDVSGLSSGTKITWKNPKKGGKAAYYYVLYRETDKSMWERKIRVYGTEVYLPISKDNYIFAVQACDASGHESLPVFVKGNN